MMKPTVKLRFIKRLVDKDVCRILQQQWIDDDPPDEGAIRDQWRDVPTGHLDIAEAQGDGVVLHDTAVAWPYTLTPFTTT